MDKQKEFESLKEYVKRLRANLLVHSYIYYRLNDNIISDERWQEIAQALAEVQRECGYVFGYYDIEFKDWTGDTGMHLPQDAWVVYKANELISMRDNAIEKEKEKKVE